MPMPGFDTLPQRSAPAGNDYQSAISRRVELITERGTDATQFEQDRTNIKAAADNEAKIRNAQMPSTVQTNQTSGFKSVPGNDLRSKIVNYASTFKGTPYVWGGESLKEGGFDCSGLVQYVYGKMGVQMPRVSQQQATQGKMTSVQNLRPGDFVAWGNSPATAHHIAIYAGNGMVWEAPHRGASVRLRRINPSERGIMGIALGI